MLRCGGHAHPRPGQEGLRIVVLHLAVAQARMRAAGGDLLLQQRDRGIDHAAIDAAVAIEHDGRDDAVHASCAMPGRGSAISIARSSAAIFIWPP